MIDDYAISEIARRLGNVVRTGQISAVDGRLVKVKDGVIETGFMPIISLAGDTSSWSPPTLGEHVLYLCPYGELSQGVVLRSIHYDDFDKPTDKTTENVVLFKDGARLSYDHETHKMDLFSDKSELKAVLKESILELLNDGINLKFGDSVEITLNKDRLKLRAFNSSISVEKDNIRLQAGSDYIDLGDGGIYANTGSSDIMMDKTSISISSDQVSVYPPVCMCEGV